MASDLENNTQVSPSGIGPNDVDSCVQDDLDHLNLSRFSEHLHTNYIPSLSEIPEIKEVADSVADRMSVYDTEIGELELQLMRLRGQRKTLQVSYDAHMALVSPFRRLPPEVVQVIFVWCLPTNRNAVMDASEAPLLLGRVCSDWRRLVFATSAMWASLHIVPPASSTARFESKRDLVASWLGRAGTCLLDISFVWVVGESHEETGLCEMLLCVLIPFAKQWRSLYFQLPLHMFRPFEALELNSTPALQNLVMVDNRPAVAGDLWPWPACLNFVNGATRLRSFTLNEFRGGFRLPTLPLSELTTLSLESNMLFFFDNAREMLGVLSKCQQLQHCTLRLPLCPTVVHPYEAIIMPTILPELNFLCVDCDQHLEDTFHISNTIGNLITPRLRQLELYGRPGSIVITPGERVPTVASSIQRMLRNSACPLEKFSLESIVLEGRELVDCLKLTPTLSQLSAHNWSAPYNPFVPGIADAADQPIQDGTSEEELLKALTYPPRESEPTFQVLDTVSGDPPVPSICPKLEQFNVFLGNVSQKLFRDFVVSRMRHVPSGGVPLKVARCTFTTFEEKSTKAQIDELLHEGLSAFTSYRTPGVPGLSEINPSPWTGLDNLPL